MAERPALLVGSDTQNLEGHAVVTGVQRVVREGNAAMTDQLGQRGIQVVPLHTRREPRRREFRSNPYLAADPVMDQRPCAPEDVDAFVLLDLHTHADYARLHQERRRRPRPVVSLVHDIMPILRPEWWPPAPDRVFRIYVQQLLAVSDHVVFTSQKVRADVSALGWRMPGEGRVIPLGSSFRQRAPEAPPDDRISILYVSTIEPRKGHDILIDAFELLREGGHDVDLTIVGREGWQRDDVIARIASHPDLGGRLRWHRAADDLTVATLARGCSIGVFPAEDEGFGLFLEEGLAYGLKMVVSDIPVFRERAGANVSFAQRTPEDFAAAILTAHRSAWDAGIRVRTMQDFGHEVAGLVEEALGIVVPTSRSADPGH